MNLETYISESISGKKKVTKRYTPERGCSTEELVEWFRDNGVEKTIGWGSRNIPKVGEFTCTIGPKARKPKAGKEASQWIKLCYRVDSNTRQSVIFRPFEDECTFETLTDQRYTVPVRTTVEIPFEDAIEIAEKLFSRPTTPVNMK